METTVLLILMVGGWFCLDRCMAISETYKPGNVWAFIFWQSLAWLSAGVCAVAIVYLLAAMGIL